MVLGLRVEGFRVWEVFSGASLRVNSKKMETGVRTIPAGIP